MISFWKIGLKRAKPVFFLFMGLYVIATLEIAFFGYFMNIQKENRTLLTYSYGGGVAGLLAGMTMVHYIIARNFSYEMGNLETLGYSRISYIFFYAVQFLIVFLISLPVTLVLLMIVYFLANMQDLGMAVYFSLFMKSALIVFSLMIFSAISALVYFSRREPILLLKEKA